MNDKLRFGLIGCGAQGRYLSEALRLTGAAELIACADVRPEAAQAAAAHCGYKHFYSDLHDLLEQEELDAVVVAVVHDQLQPCGLAVVASGRHLFIEKPMALTAAAGRELAAAARSAGKKMMVGYTLPFMPARVRLKELVRQGAVGAVVHLAAGQLIGGIGGWLARPEHGGGPLLYIGTHVIYQVLDLIDAAPERVFAEIAFTESGVDAEALFSVRFAGGITAQFTVSQRLGCRYGWIDVFGDAGRIHSEWESNALTVHSRDLAAYRDPTTIEVPAEVVGPTARLGDMASVNACRYSRAWAAEFVEFIGAIREDRRPRVAGEDGVRVLEITDAVFASGRAGRPVCIPRS
ncbi:MAG: Gfo/Idh/MocA family oxidoreductase [Kiritimatiellaeota bacterium]|nr:Gfo/Idh/MocA family oxidoreductase [Kiritimatiellota bacterium]